MKPDLDHSMSEVRRKSSVCGVWPGLQGKGWRCSGDREKGSSILDNAGGGFLSWFLLL